MDTICTSVSLTPVVHEQILCVYFAKALTLRKKFLARKNYK